MKTLLRSLIVGLFAIAVSVAFAAFPGIDVTVLDSSGKTTSKGKTDGNGTFATGTLKPGQYVVQFNSKTAPKGKRYALIASAGKEKVVANGIPGEKLAPGVAMTIKVPPASRLAAQVTAEDKNSTPIGNNGKLMVWIPKRIGSNIPGHWAESDSAEAKIAMTSSSYSLKNMQNKHNQGVSGLNNDFYKTSTSNLTNPATGK